MTDPPRKISAAAVVVFYAILGGGALALARFVFEVDPFVPFPERPQDLTIALLLGAGVGLLTVLVSQLLERFFEWSRAMTRAIREALGRINRQDALILALASSLGEELLFRGLLLPTTSLVASSLIFGVVHGLSPGPVRHMWDTLKRMLPLVIAATAMGFAFGFMVEYTGNIFAAVIAHFTINFLNLSEMYRKQWHTEGQGGDDG